jgi:glucose-1-phosphate thymidylyltransferase
MKALILAAGYATRLYPLTKEYPKPLLKLNKKPIIDYILENLGIIEEIDEIIVLTNSKFISHFRRWAKKKKIQKRLSLVDDLTKSLKGRLGAIGDMRFAIEKKCINEDLLVIGGDNLFDGSLRKFLAFSKTHKKNPLIGAYNIRNKEKARHYGVIKLDKENRLIDFQEKPKKPNSTLVAMCLYYFPKNRLGLIKKYLNNKNQKPDTLGLYIDWLRKQAPVYGFKFNGLWYDIGDHRFYNEAKNKFKY